MPRMCTQKQSLVALFVAFVASAPWGTAAFAAEAGQRPEVQRLFQAGDYNEAVEKAQDADPASIYLAAQALMRLEDGDRAGATFERLRASGEAWALVAASGQALLANDGARALDTARRATEAGADNSWAHYQLGLAASKQSDFATADRAFVRSIEIKNDFAYAHYYAALAYQRQRQLSKASEHFDAFLHLAPDAPERQAVAAIMRTLK